MPFKVLHERWKCIGCSACAAVAPDYWVMADDGKSDIKGATHKKVPEGTLEELPVDEKAAAVNKDAAEACPVSCIHVQESAK